MYFKKKRGRRIIKADDNRSEERKVLGGTREVKKQQQRSTQEISKITIYSLRLCIVQIDTYILEATGSHLLFPFVPWGKRHAENKQIKLPA